MGHRGQKCQIPGLGSGLQEQRLRFNKNPQVACPRGRWRSTAMTRAPPDAIVVCAGLRVMVRASSLACPKRFPRAGGRDESGVPVHLLLSLPVDPEREPGSDPALPVAARQLRGDESATSESDTLSPLLSCSHARHCHLRAPSARTRPQLWMALPLLETSVTPCKNEPPPPKSSDLRPSGPQARV